MRARLMRVCRLASLSIIVTCGAAASAQAPAPCQTSNSAGLAASANCATVERFGGIRPLQPEQAIAGNASHYQVVNTARAAPPFINPAPPAVDAPSAVQFRAILASS